MRRDSIFYSIFQQFPELLFELIGQTEVGAIGYSFDSVAIKEPKFEIDGVFLPPDSGDARVVYFCEVQFQKDEQLYERIFGESMLYFYRHRSRFSDWQVVVIYPSRSLEQKEAHPYRIFLSSDQVHRIYLDELAPLSELPIGVALMRLTALSDQDAPQAARSLLARSQQEEQTAKRQRAIMEMVNTIMVYKFTNLTRIEVEAMLGITLQETRVYKDAKAEGEKIGELLGEQRGTLIGELRGKKLMIQQVLAQALGSLPEAIDQGILLLSEEELGRLTGLVLSFSDVSVLELWLRSAIAATQYQAILGRFGDIAASMDSEIQALSLVRLIELDGIMPELSDVASLQSWIESL
jgi:predicted transposase/invertase (TIGR01784 family)